MLDAMYLLATLPHVDLETTKQDHVHSIESFLEACEVLGDDIIVGIRNAVTSPGDSDYGIARLWAEYDYSIKNEIAKRRWANLRSGSYPEVLINDSVPISAEAIDIAQSISHEQNPLIAEQSIIKQKWLILESLDAQYQSSIENVLVYAWKLTLYHNYNNLTEERGREQWNSLLAVVAEQSGFSISTINGGGNG